MSLRFLPFGFLFFLALFGAGASQASEGSVYDLPVVFKNEASEPVSLQDWKGKRVVITMAYTSCQFACPRILKKLEDVQKEADRLKKPFQFVIITMDPVTDTPDRLKRYRKESSHLEKNWTFLSGTEAGVRQASMVFGIRYSKNADNGVISHDSKILLLDEKGLIVKVLNGLSADVRGFLE